MQLFENLLKASGDTLEADIADAREKLSQLQNLCGELQVKIDNVHLNDVDNLPAKPVADDEKVLGTLPDELRRFDVVRLRMFEEMRAECNRVHGEVVNLLLAKSLFELAEDDLRAEIAERYPEYAKNHERASLIDNLFWNLVHEAFPEAEADDEESGGIGIRENWQVVILPAKKKSPIIIGAPFPIPNELGELLMAMGRRG
jgi:hypothetical protein